MELARDGDGVAVAALGAVGDEDDAVVAAGALCIGRADRHDVVLDGLKRACERRWARAADLAIAATAMVADVARRLVIDEARLASIQPAHEVTRGRAEAAEDVRAATRWAAASCVVDALIAG